ITWVLMHFPQLPLVFSYYLPLRHFCQKFLNRLLKKAGVPMQSPKKYGGIAKYVLTLLVATIASVQVAAFGMADFRVYQDMKSDIAEIERRMPRQQDSAGVDPGSVHYAGLGRIVIDGEVVQERTPAVPRPAVQPDPEPVQAPETSQPPPQ
ncbi:MAG: hypothetical protein HFF66_02270, partial [Oscillospiraceae bacterium]|nr:hypothetical protein [Oscillospiraceae bacterium]